MVAQTEPFAGGTVVGNVVALRGIEAPRLGRTHDLVVYLPSSHESSDRRYPVIYAHDAQNLFDEATSNAGEWRFDETMEELAAEGLEAIVVGLPHGDAQRAEEYSPWPFGPYAGRAADHVADVVDTLKPLVDSTFRTQPERRRTIVLGSSLGGLVSLYALFSRPDVFGAAGVFSPAFWWGTNAIFDWIEPLPAADARIYLDVGTRERPEEPVVNEAYVAGLHRMADLLRAKGYGDDDLRVVVDEGAIHHESAWARRLPDALRFLLASG